MDTLKRIVILLLFCLNNLNFAQTQVSDEILESMDDDLSVGNDIFSDFQENVESAQILEDERFYRYGRFFSVNLGIGHTTFTGNRGTAFADKFPTFHFSLSYFLDFLSAVNFGVEFSKHQMTIDFSSKRFPNNADIGAIDVSIIRPFVAYRFYIDTSNLSSVFTYSNPYFTGRLEYWYQTNKFLDSPNAITDGQEKGGGLGGGFGLGVEFPLEFKKRYLGIEALIHPVNYFDGDVTSWRPGPTNPDPVGYDDLKGLGWSVKTTFNLTW